MPDPEAAPVPILYVTDLGEPADLFDIVYLIRSPEYDLRGICLTGEADEGPLDGLLAAAHTDVARFAGAEQLRAALAAAEEPVNLVAVGGYDLVAEALAADRALFRSRVARLFLVGGYVNAYGDDAGAPVRLPINPRLRELHPERFAGRQDARAARSGAAFATLLASGEGVIWLPRDIALWRFWAPGMLAGGGPVADFLLGDNTDQAVLLSTLPALLLARRPDPFAWLRLFRAVAAQVEVDANGVVTGFHTRTDAPNLYAVVAIDGQALSRLVAAGLRDHPLVAEGD